MSQNFRFDDSPNYGVCPIPKTHRRLVDAHLEVAR